MPMLRKLSEVLGAALRRLITIRAIIERELRVTARRPATYRIRWMAMLAALGLILWKLLSFTFQQAPTSQQGRSLFVMLSVLAFIYCLFAGVRATSDCISEEKRDGTLGLLFLTDLKGIDVALGKLTATSLNAFYGLLAIFPALAIPVVFGGVTLVDFAKMVLVLLVTLFLSLTMGLFVSSVSRHERKAASATVAAVFAPTFIPLALLLAATWTLSSGKQFLDFEVFFFWIFGGRSPDSFTWAVLSAILSLELFNPIYALVCVLLGNRPLPFPGMPTFPTGSLWLSLGLIHIASWAALLQAARTLPKVWKDRPASKTVIDWRERWLRFSQGDPVARAKFRTLLLNLNPFYWLAARDRVKPYYAWLFLFSMACVWLWRYLKEPDVMFDFYPLIPTILIIHTFLKIWVAAESSQRLIEDQRSGAVELLLSTPVQIAEMVRGQLLGLRRQFAMPFLVLCLVELAVFSQHYSPAAILLVQTMLLADALTLMWVSIWLSLRARNLNYVVLLSIGLVLTAPWLASLSVLMVLERFPTARNPSTYQAGWLALLLIFGAWLVAWRGLRQGNLDQLKRTVVSALLVAPWTLYLVGLTIYQSHHGMASPRRTIPFEQRVLIWFVVGMIFNIILLRWAIPRVLGNFREAVLHRFERTPESAPRLKLHLPTGAEIAPAPLANESFAHRRT
jgi:hypothetical protein